MSEEDCSNTLALNRRDIFVSIISVIASFTATTILARPIINYMVRIGILEEPDLQFAISNSIADEGSKTHRVVHLSNGGYVDIDDFQLKMGLTKKINDYVLVDVDNILPQSQIDIEIDSDGVAHISMDNFPKNSIGFDHIIIKFILEPNENTSHESEMCKISNIDLYASYRYSFETHGQEFDRVLAPSSSGYGCSSKITNIFG